MGFLRFIRFAVLVFVLGGLGGLFFNYVAVPWLLNISPFSKIEFLHNIKDGVTIVKPIEQVIVRETQSRQKVFTNAARFIGRATVYDAQTKTPRVAAGGSLVTSDGGFITLSRVALELGEIEIAYNGQTLSARATKIDAAKGLALLKVDGAGFPTPQFREEELQLGSELFFLWQEPKGASRLQESYVSKAPNAQSLFVSDVSEIPPMDQGGQGALLFDGEGKLAALLEFGIDGKPRFIPATIVKSFLEQ